MPVNQNIEKTAGKRGASPRILIFALILSAAIAALCIFPLKPQQSLPDFLAERTQGYERFLAAAQEIAGRPVYVTNNFANYVAMNQRAYDAIDRTLHEDLEAPTSWYKPGMMNPMDLGAFKALGRALLIRSKAAESEGRIAAALKDSFETIRFGQKVEHGPIINFMVGSAIELMAVKRLEELLPQVDGTNLATAVATLRRLNRARLPYSEIKRREEYFFAKNTTNAVQSIRERFSRHIRKVFNDSEERYLATAAQVEILATLMATKGYELTHNAKPNTLADLTPAFLESPPIDPFSKKPLHIVKTNDQLIIYSVGPNKRDDFGKPDDISLGHEDTIGMRMLTNALKQFTK